MAGIRGTKTRALAIVRWSAPSLCEVCRGTRVVALVWREGGEAGAMRCPHCAGVQPVEIRTYPRFRDDRPGGDAA